MQHLPQGGTAALVKEQHKVKILHGGADGGKIGQRHGHMGQHGAARLLGGLGGNAVVPFVLGVLFFGCGHTVTAEKRNDPGHAQFNAVADDLLKLALLGVTRKQRYGAVRFGLAGRAVSDRELCLLYTSRCV